MAVFRANGGLGPCHRARCGSRRGGLGVERWLALQARPIHGHRPHRFPGPVPARLPGLSSPYHRLDKEKESMAGAS